MATQTIAAYDLRTRRHSQEVADRNLYLFAAQQRARRGPTPEVFFPKRLDNTRLVKAADPVRVREMRIFTAALSILFVCVMFYGWQHFSAIEFGYKVEAEKAQKAQLEEQNRALRLTQAQLDAEAAGRRIQLLVALGGDFRTPASDAFAAAEQP